MALCWSCCWWGWWGRDRLHEALAGATAGSWTARRAGSSSSRLATAASLAAGAEEATPELVVLLLLLLLPLLEVELSLWRLRSES